MYKPVIFDDLSKKAKGMLEVVEKWVVDVLNDDYFVGSKLTMKVKHIKGVVCVLVVELIFVEFDSWGEELLW